MSIDLVLMITIGSLIGSLIGLSWFAGTDAPYVPTMRSRLKGILEKAGVKKGKIFYELGSGDGRVVLDAASLEAESYGIEQSWLRVWFSRFKAKRLNLPNAHFYHGNLFDREYFPADIVYIYLLQKAVDKLEEKLKKELHKNAVVITQTYHFRNWKPFKKQGNFWFYKKV